MPFLGNQEIGDIPIINNWEFATTSARVASLDPNTGLAYQTASLGKVGKQTDTTPPSYWLLQSTVPTWDRILTSSATSIGTIATLSPGNIWVGSSGSVVSSLAPGSSNTILAVQSGGATPIYKTFVASTNITITHSGSTISIGAAAGGGGGGLTGFGFNMPGSIYTTSLTGDIPFVILSSAMTLSSVRIATHGVVSGNLIVDVLYHVTAPNSMTTVFTTSANRPTIASGASIGSNGGVPDVTALAQNGCVGFIVASVGSANGLAVTGRV